MTDERGDGTRVSVGLLVSLGLGVGALLGLALARRAAHRSHTEISESVEELKDRTQRVLSELSAKLEQAMETGRNFAAVQVETLQETIVHSAEES